MRHLKITPMTDAVLQSSTIPETDHPVYDPMATYDLNQYVIVLSVHKVFQSVQAGNTGNNPLDDTQFDENNPPVWWQEVSATNRWMPFDGQRNNQAVAEMNMTYVMITSSRVDTVSILNADAQFVDVKVEFNDTVIYDQSIRMVTRVTRGFLEFWTKPFQVKKICLSEICRRLLVQKSPSHFADRQRVRCVWAY